MTNLAADSVSDEVDQDAKIDFTLESSTLSRTSNGTNIAVSKRATTVVFAGLAKMNELRGYRLDPCGNTDERRLERAFIDGYQKLLADDTTRRTSDSYQTAVELVGLADQLRGSSDIKLARIARYCPATESARNDWSAS